MTGYKLSSLMMAMILVMLIPAVSFSQLPAVSGMDERDNIDGTNFKIVPRVNYLRSNWIVRISDGEIIGYAPWEIEQRRWTLFNLHGQYRGFIQATMGQEDIQNYKQYLWYDRNNKYLGVFITSLGGHPRTKDYKEGELGGSLDLYKIGNFPLKPYQLLFDIDPNKSHRPMGINSTLIRSLPRGR